MKKFFCNLLSNGVAAITLGAHAVPNGTLRMAQPNEQCDQLHLSHASLHVLQQLLAAVPALAKHASAESVRALARAAKRAAFPPSTIMLMPGAVVDGLLLIEEGQAEVAVVDTRQEERTVLQR